MLTREKPQPARNSWQLLSGGSNLAVGTNMDLYKFVVYRVSAYSTIDSHLASQTPSKVRTGTTKGSSTSAADKSRSYIGTQREVVWLP